MNKEEISLTLDSMAKRYFPDLKYQFKGFYKKDTPEVALASGDNGILLKEEGYNLSDDQLERALVHELQHIQDRSDTSWNEKGEGNNVYGFVFHPKFQDLYKRLEEFYKGKSEEGVELALQFLPLPKSLGEYSLLKSYSHPTEVLARLRGYEHYLNQVKEGVEVETLPYESIEAFKEEDLKFLELEYRKELTEELKLQNPEIFETGVAEKVVIEESDLAKPKIS